MKSLKKQGGFTLLELLVVVGLMAAVAVVAVSTYDGADESAAISTDLSNIQSIDQGFHNFAGKNNGNLPEQLDNLVDTGGVAYYLLGTETKAALQALPVTGKATATAIREALEENGMEEFQSIIALNNKKEILYKQEPNTQHAEASGNGEELEADDVTALTVVATKLTTSTLNSTGQCKVDDVDYSTKPTLAGTTVLPKALALNAINDQFESGACNVVVALGVGGDAAANSQGAIGLTSSDAVKDRADYSRYLALFHVAQDGFSDGNEDGVILKGDVFPKPRFVGVINPLGQGPNQLNKLKNTQ
jgi:prepilin-type N-terminal cleavage/methylation domain-containing protein